MITFLDSRQIERSAQVGFSTVQSVNGELSVKGTIYTNDDVLKNVDRGWRFRLNDEYYRIIYVKPIDTGNQIEVEFDAVHQFFYDMAKSSMYEVLNGTHSLRYYLEAIFKNSGYKFDLDIDVKSIRKSDFGCKSRLSLFNDIIKTAGVEFLVSGHLVRIRKSIGSDQSTLVRKNFNMNEITIEKDINSFVTYQKGFGAWKDETDRTKGRYESEYESPLAKIYGRIEAEPVVDERYKETGKLLERLKENVDKSYKISVEIDMEDLSQAGYQMSRPNPGDYIMAINETLGFRQKVRIVSFTSEYDVGGHLISRKVVCNDIGSVQRRASEMSSFARSVQDVAAGNAKAIATATRALVSADGKNTNYFGDVKPLDVPKGTLRKGDRLFLTAGDETELYFWSGSEWVIEPTRFDKEKFNVEFDKKAEAINKSIQRVESEAATALAKAGANALLINEAQKISEQAKKQLNLQFADYKQSVDGRFASLITRVDNKADLVEFQRVQETSKLYERIIGNSESDIAEKVSRMALTSQLFQVEVGKTFANHQNLFFTSTITKGFLRNTNDGIIELADATKKEVTSDFISVVPNEKIIFQHWVTLPENGMAWSAWQFFDKNKNAIDVRRTGVNAYKTATGKQHNINQIAVPANAYFVRFSARMYNDGLIKVERGSIPSDYSVAPNDALEAVRTVQSQLAGSWVVQNINSAGDLISGLNLGANGHNRLDGKLTHITGETLIDNAVIKSAMIESVLADKITTGTLNAASVNIINLNANKIVGLDATFLRGKIENAIIDWLVGKTLISQNGSTTLNLQTGVFTLDNENSSITFSRSSDNTATTFSKNGIRFLKNRKNIASIGQSAFSSIYDNEHKSGFSITLPTDQGISFSGYDSSPFFEINPYKNSLSIQSGFSLLIGLRTSQSVSLEHFFGTQNNVNFSGFRAKGTRRQELRFYADGRIEITRG